MRIGTGGLASCMGLEGRHPYQRQWARVSDQPKMTVLASKPLQASSHVAVRPPRIALAHDWLVGMRGGEWVLDRLARMFGPTDLYTLVSDGRPLTPAISQCRVVTSPLQGFPRAAGAWRRRYLPLMPWAVHRLRVAPCDLVISTSSAVVKSLVPPEGTPHLCYCHSPARYIWEQAEDYAGGSGGLWRKFGLRAVRRRFQDWDRRTAHRVTMFLANSAHSAARVNRCYGRDAEVVYPPVRTNFFTIDESIQREEWFLVVAALEPYKRTDLVINAANRARFRLRIAGDGTQRRRLQSIAGPTVQMLGRVSDRELVELYRRARGLIFPQVEDFGIIAVEAQAAGCPVIAYAGGGALETVTERTGVFFERHDPDAIVDAIREFERRTIDAGSCQSNAIRFSEEVFDQSIQAHVARLLNARQEKSRSTPGAVVSQAI